MPGLQTHAGRDHHIASADIVPGPPHEIARRPRRPDQHRRAAVKPHRAAVQPHRAAAKSHRAAARLQLRVLHGNDTIRPLGHGRAGHDLAGLVVVDPGSRPLARVHRPHHAQPRRRLGARPGNIRRPHRVPVHLRVHEQRKVHRRPQILRQHRVGARHKRQARGLRGALEQRRQVRAHHVPILRGGRAGRGVGRPIGAVRHTPTVTALYCAYRPARGGPTVVEGGGDGGG